jgi:hypothetical protein
MAITGISGSGRWCCEGIGGGGADGVGAALNCARNFLSCFFTRNTFFFFGNAMDNLAVALNSTDGALLASDMIIKVGDSEARTRGPT